MSLFDYPRINFAGTIQLNPGTANNDDYAQQPGAAVIPQSFGPPWAGQIFGLIDSKMVQARRFGMTDEQFVAWVQKAQTFDTPGGPAPTADIIPAEWNYYGDMGSQDIDMKVVGVQTAPNANAGSGAPGAIIGATVKYSGNITDVNSEGSPPATQFFLHRLRVISGGTTLLSGAASKGCCQWLNFYRNVNLVADGGAGGYVYHVIRTGHGTVINLPGFDDPKIAGVICRYYLYNFQTARNNIEQLYQQQKTNPATLQIVGTFAPLYSDETITTGPVGRLMVCDTPTIKTPPGSQNNSSITNNDGLIALGPAVLRAKGNAISVDFSGTFPDNYQTSGTPPVATNAKYKFGAVTLMVSNASGSAAIGPVDYTDTDGGNSRGWIFDFDISANPAAQQILQDPAAKFSLQSEQYDTVLTETDYYVVTNQQGIYAEQNGPGGSFLNQGTSEPATVSVYHRGRELGAAECPPISVWQYRSVPIQSPGNAENIATDFKPGQPLQVDTSQPGNFLFTFAIDAPAGYPPQSYNSFYIPPYITNAPSISLRILPNDEDFSGYYVDPTAKEPVGNDKLTFKVVYEKVLRTYYLLYPAMNVQAFPLNDETQVTQNAQGILGVTDPAQWMSGNYMPRTRDMSASRRTLLRAWCWKVKPGGSA